MRRKLGLVGDEADGLEAARLQDFVGADWPPRRLDELENLLGINCHVVSFPSKLE